MSFGIAKYDAAEVHRAGAMMATYGDDKSVFAEFYNKPILQEFESQQKARKIYKEIPYLLITFPGDRTKTWDQPVRLESDGNSPSDPQRFPRQWEAFQRQQEQVPDGMPITEFAALGRARCMELKSMNIHTVEQYAGVPDGQIEGLGLGARKERDICRAALDRSASVAQVTSLTQKTEDQAARISYLEEQIKALGIMKKEEDGQPVARRGRPPKGE